MKTRIMWFIVGLVAALIISLPWICKAEIKAGCDIQTGTDVILTDGWQSDEWANTVDRASVRIETNDILWQNLWLGVEGVYSRHKGHSKIIAGHDARFIDWGINFTARYQPFENWPYIGGLAGASYWFNRDLDVGDLGDHPNLWTFGGMIGKDWGIFTTRWSIRTEIRATHTSSGDGFGKNYGSALIGVSYTF